MRHVYNWGEPMTLHHLHRCCLTLAAVVVTTLSAACTQAPAEVEGTFNAQPFTIADETPEVHRSKRTGSMMLVFSDVTKDRLRTLSLSIPGDLELKEDAAYRLGQDGGHIQLEVSEGRLVVQSGKNGTNIRSSVETEFGVATDGYVVFASVGQRMAGEFRAELDIGDVIRGSFDVQLEADDADSIR